MSREVIVLIRMLGIRFRIFELVELAGLGDAIHAATFKDYGYECCVVRNYWT
jgi:hypothetical protein